MLIKGRNNLSLTIVLPFKCSNNCKFCDINPGSNKDISKILNSLKVLNDVSFEKRYIFNEVVLTGGEPFADMNKLSKIFKYVIHYSKAVYINTSEMTMDNAIELKRILDDSPNKVAKNIGINISRHGSSECGDRVVFNSNTYLMTDDDIASLSNLGFSIRINSVIDQYDLESIPWIIRRWKEYRGKLSLSLRGDYNMYEGPEPKELKTYDQIMKIISDKFAKADPERFLIDEISQCDACYTVHYILGKKFRFSYHRGSRLSSVDTPDGILVNDIILKSDGELYSDWDFKSKITAIDARTLLCDSVIHVE